MHGARTTGLLFSNEVLDVEGRFGKEKELGLEGNNERNGGVVNSSGFSF